MRGLCRQIPAAAQPGPQKPRTIRSLLAVPWLISSFQRHRWAECTGQSLANPAFQTLNCFAMATVKPWKMDATRSVVDVADSPRSVPEATDTNRRILWGVLGSL